MPNNKYAGGKWELAVAKLTASLLVFLFMFQTPLLLVARAESISTSVETNGGGSPTVAPENPVTSPEQKNPTFSPLPDADPTDPATNEPPPVTPPKKTPTLSPAKPTEAKPKEVLPIEKLEKEKDGGEDTLDVPIENPNTVKSILPDVDTLTGALVYKYPVALPPGRNNATPELNLVYNSSNPANNSPIGYGWSLSIPYIERINREGSEQLYTNNTFASSLTGELVFQTGSTYISKVDDGSFLNYQYDGTVWIAYDKSGTRYSFGTTAGTRQDNASSTDKIYKWMIDEVRDTNGNFIRFTYNKENNQIYPASIFYSGSGSTDGIFEVDFVYENRDDAVPDNAPAFKVVTLKRVSKIQIKINNSLTKEYLLGYTAGYNAKRSLLASVTASSTTTLPPTEFQYQKITKEQTFNPSTYQLPSYWDTGTSKYAFLALNTARLLMDVNDDGLLDFISSEDYNGLSQTVPDNNDKLPRVYLNSGTTWQFNSSFFQLPSYWDTGTNRYVFPQINSGHQMVDVNGDALPDFVESEDTATSTQTIVNNNDKLARTYLNTGNGWQFDSNLYQLPSYFDTATGQYNFPQLTSGQVLADVNGDGLPDFILTKDYSTTTATITNNYDQLPRVYLNTGTGWQFNPSLYQIPSYWDTSVNKYTFLILNSAHKLIDVNGDGLLDFVDTEDVSTTTPTIANNNNQLPRVYLNTGTGWQFNSNFQLPSYWDTSVNKYTFPVLGTGHQMVDVNGDGLPDFVMTEDIATTTPILVNNNDKLSRTYLNTGSGWQFDPNFYQLPSYWDTATNKYNFPLLNLGHQLVDINGDNLPDFVESEDTATSTQIIANNNDKLSRAYLNTGTGWQFSSTTYQMPSYLDTSTGQYNFPQLSSGHLFADVNGDVVPDLIASEDISTSTQTIANNNNQLPRPYSNAGESSDYLASVNLSEGGSLYFDYKPQALKSQNSNVPFYPQNIYAVQHLSSNDGFSNWATSTYSYTDGKYYYYPEQFKQFAGFAHVDKTDPVGNVKKTYFHQGNASATSTGEYLDHAPKLGRPYRVEQYDTSGNLYTKTINKWDRYDRGSGSSFVKLANSVNFAYDGDSDHKEKASEFTYDNSTGNTTEKIEWGEVTGSDDGTFSDTGSDKLTTDFTYAASSTASYVSLPASATTTNQSAVTISAAKYYYDTLSFGAVIKGNLTKEEKWKSGSTYINTQKTYNSYGLVTDETDPRGKITTHTYDSFNLYKATSTNPLSQVNTLTYDYSTGKPTQNKDPNGYIFQNTFDGFGRIKEVKQPDNTTPTTLITKTLYTYTDSGMPRLVQKANYLNAATSTEAYIYSDGLGRLIQTRTEAKDPYTFMVKDTAYNGVGKISKESLPYFSNYSTSTSATSTATLYTNYIYDPLLRVKTIANAVGTTTNAYDDWKTTVTDALGKIKDLTKDAYENLTRVDEHTSTTTYATLYEWNGNKNLTKITDASGNVRNLTYDGLGRVLTAEDLHVSTDSYFGTWNYSYDDAGNLASSTDPASHNTVYTYDDINRRLTENDTSRAGTEITYGYDTCLGGKGRLCFATTSTLVLSNEWNPNGQLKKETKKIFGTDYVTLYTNDRQGNPLTITHPDSAVITYAYNDAGLLDKVTWKELYGPLENLATNLTYSPIKQITYILYGNNASTTNTYDAANLYRLSKKVSGITGTKFQDLAYTYDAVGNITKIIDTSNTNSAKTTDYIFDDLYRLTVASTTNAIGGNYRHTFAYSAIGNIATSSDQGLYQYAGDQSTNYANPHAVTSINGATVTYDNVGNLLTNGTLTNTWDYQNRLTKLITSATTTYYLYDPNGDRLTTKVNSLATSTTISSLYETNGSLTTNTKHVYIGDDLIATIVGTDQPEINGPAPESGGLEGAVLHFVHDDHLAGSNVVSDESATLEELTDYYPYGKLKLDQTATSFKEKKKYTGHEYDVDTGLTYAKARYYSGATGRFQSQDPAFQNIGNPKQIKGKTGLDLEQYLSDPQSLNSYSYVKNNPLKYKDPTGEWFQEFLTGNQSWPSFQNELGQAATQLSQDNKVWNAAISHPVAAGSIIGIGVGTVAVAAGSEILTYYGYYDTYKNLRDLTDVLSNPESKTVKEMNLVAGKNVVDIGGRIVNALTPTKYRQIYESVRSVLDSAVSISEQINDQNQNIESTRAEQIKKQAEDKLKEDEEERRRSQQSNVVSSQH